MNLGQLVQANRLNTMSIVSRMLGILDIKRPSLSQCSIDTTSSIFSYIARENIDCAFHCEPDTNGQKVRELCTIAMGELGADMYVHLSLHPESELVIREKSAHDMLPYFEVSLSDQPQNSEVQVILLEQFKQLFIQAQNDHK